MCLCTNSGVWVWLFSACSRVHLYPCLSDHSMLDVPTLQPLWLWFCAALGQVPALSSLCSSSGLFFFLPILSPSIIFSFFLERESCSMGGRRTCPGAGGADGLAGLSLSHGHGSGSPSSPIPYPGDVLQAKEELG